MSGKYFEFKVRVSSKDEAREKLQSIISGEPKIKSVIDTYFVSDLGAEKIYDSGDKVFHTVVESTPDGFRMNAQLIDESEKEKFFKNHKIDKAMKKLRTIWEVGGMHVAIDEVGSLGVFVEFQGEDKEKLFELISSAGFSEKDFILVPYNKL